MCHISVSVEKIQHFTGDHWIGFENYVRNFRIIRKMDHSNRIIRKMGNFEPWHGVVFFYSANHVHVIGASDYNRKRRTAPKIRVVILVTTIEDEKKIMKNWRNLKKPGSGFLGI